MAKRSRREFVKAGAVASVAMASAPRAWAQAPAVLTRGSVKPVVVASANGNQYKNGGPRVGVEEAFARMVKGEDVLDARDRGGQHRGARPRSTTAWATAGLPNAEGVVQLDSCCMHGPRKRAGGVAGTRGRAHSRPSWPAPSRTRPTITCIVGKGAQDFAQHLGFAIEDDLNTENSRKKWLEWKRRIDPEHYLDPAKRRARGGRWRASRWWPTACSTPATTVRHHQHETASSPKGEICGVTTTSGLAWKIPGRVGDSPILGAGLYVDGDVGAAGSTGRGEANLYNLSSYLIVENLRRGMAPKDAGMEALKRIRANTVEKRLLDAAGPARVRAAASTS